MKINIVRKAVNSIPKNTIACWNQVNRKDIGDAVKEYSICKGLIGMSFILMLIIGAGTIFGMAAYIMAWFQTGFEFKNALLCVAVMFLGAFLFVAVLYYAKQVTKNLEEYEHTINAFNDDVRNVTGFSVHEEYANWVTLFQNAEFYVKAKARSRIEKKTSLEHIINHYSCIGELYGATREAYEAEMYFDKAWKSYAAFTQKTKEDRDYMLSNSGAPTPCLA